MDLSILILCIISMTSFHPVDSSDSLQPSSNSAPLLDFGFLPLIEDLVSADDNSTNQKAMLAIFEEVKNQLKSSSESVKSIKKIIRHGMMYNTDLDIYFMGIHHIDVLYESMERYSRHETIDMQKLDCLAGKCIFGEEESIYRTLHIMRHAHQLTGNNFMKLLIKYGDIEESSLTDSKEAVDNNCALVKQSSQYKIYEIYHELVILIAKAYAMKIYGMTLRRKQFIRYKEVNAVERKKYEKTIRYYQKFAASAMTNASRDIRSCDSAFSQEKEQKFIELKWLFNTIVINEAYLNENGSCWETCDYYQATSFYQYADQPLGELNICRGKIYNCFRQNVHSYCPAIINSRRFDGLFPTKIGITNCSHTHGLFNEVYSGSFNVCEPCMCYCDDYDRNDTIRTFGLRAVESDTSKNRVITGIQFVEKNRTIYLRIQDGELRPNGIIDKSTVEWQPVDEIDWNSPFISPYDFFTITYDKKFVNLDTLVAPAGRVLTGIRLGAQGSHLALEIKTHAFNYTTGILGNSSHFVTEKNETTRQEITMTAPDNPIHMNQSVIDTRENTYVTFRMTDLEKDAGQTAIPFIDARPVVSDPPVPLSGAGIYYSGQTGYGGFIGLKAVTYDLAKVIGN